MHAGRAPGRPALCLLACAAVCAALAGGCAHRARGAAGGSAAEAAASAVVDRDLADAADAVTRDLAQLTGSRQMHAMAPARPGGRLHSPGTLVWDGPLEGALERACSAVGFRLAVSGKAPDVPVIVHVHDTDRPWLKIFRDIGMQSGAHASVRLIERSKLVELSWRGKK